MHIQCSHVCLAYTDHEICFASEKKCAILFYLCLTHSYTSVHPILQCNELNIISNMSIG